MAETWHVVDQRQRTTLLAGGRFGDVMTVTFETDPHGYSGSIDVPLNQYNAETVAALIDERVAHIVAVHHL